ncbi:MAG: SRPBCC family protein [Blastocatellia bacterium]|nr:SRPBCC family protein [Blastocatellia bacterium]
MAFKIEEKFDVQAPVKRVWEYLIDPARVAVCIPGAELLGSQGEDTFLGAVKVKVGPVQMSYKGTVKFTEMDEEAHQVRLVGEGRESGGAGSAKMTMLSKITPLEGGGSQVVVEAEVDIVGKIVQFGRGMIEEVSRQLFRQFSACVKQHLEVEDAEAADEPGAADAQPEEKAPAPESKPVSAAPLAFRALWAIIARAVRRLFGKKAE